MRTTSTITLAFYFGILTLSATLGNCLVVMKCREREKKALLLFKDDLLDPLNRLSSWVAADDCCTLWTGIVCHNLTGHILEIHLRNPMAPPYSAASETEFDAKYKAHLRYKLGGKINPSLLVLKHLRHLDLSRNGFEGIQIPSFIGSLGSLRYLNLSLAGFGGLIPHQIGNLSKLHYLDLKSGQIGLYSENLQWLSGLSSLQHLDLSGANFSKANTNWIQVINMLPSLIELHLSYCGLGYNDHPKTTVNFSSLAVLDISGNRLSSSFLSWLLPSLSNLVSLDIRDCFYGGGGGGVQNINSITGLQNLTRLRVLDMSYNSLNGTIPNWLHNLTHLQILNLGYNDLDGEISSAIGNLNSLITLDLSYTRLKGKIPTSLGNLCNLRDISLPGCSVGGDISEFFTSFSHCNLHKLESLDFSNNRFYGQLPDALGQFRNLVDLNLLGNSISGPIPESIGRLQSLISLGLSYNQLNGTLPDSFGQLAKLEELSIVGNSLHGVVSEVHFTNLKSLIYLYASGNKLTLKPSDEWVPPFQLKILELGSWELGPQFPKWLQSQRNLTRLVLSNTGISDTIPTWFLDISSQLPYLNLSHNHIHGEVESIVQVVNYYRGTIDLSSNNFSGPLPFISYNISFLDLSNNFFSGSLYNFLCHEVEKPKELQVLILGNNLLYGEIPNCWMNWYSLQTLRLENNRFIGSLPSSMGYLTSLQSLHLRNNILSGKLPVSLQNYTNLKTIDISHNNFNGTIPGWIGKWSSSLVILNLRSNKFHGDIPYGLCLFASLQLLDLANNNLWGKIPRCFNNFSAMMEKRQIFDGKIRYFKNDTSFSENAFSVMKGREVEYSTTLNLVRSVDLSENNLTGDIPIEITSLVELQSLNLSHNHFTGKIPSKIGDMRSIESLDLSMNQLSGEIPWSISNLTFLSHLNLSNNKLTGRIPLGTQLQGFDESGFLGNQLCGPPLRKKCSENGSTILPSVNHGGADGDGFEVDFWFFVCLGFGFVVGF